MQQKIWDEHNVKMGEGLRLPVITVSRSTWNDKNQKQWSRHQSFFCLGVIGHRKVYLSIKIKIN